MTKSAQPTFPEFNIPSDDSERVINVAAVPHRSPFRYPGGKTWLVPYTRRWLSSLKKRPADLVEIFGGGGIVGLSAIFDDQVDRLTLIELDEDVAAVWKVIFGGQAAELADAIMSFDMTRENVEAALVRPVANLLEHAFLTILRNRVLHSGILSPGASMMRKGENGRGVKSRWYAGTLRKRILDLGRIRSRVTFIHGDGIEYMRDNAKRKGAAFFIDPPYTVAGKRLYVHSEVDHDEIIRVASTVKGELLITYDNADPIRKLAEKCRLATDTIPMQNKRHVIQRELLIGKNLDWLRS